MSKETIKLNSTKKFKEITENGKGNFKKKQPREIENEPVVILPVENESGVVDLPNKVEKPNFREQARSFLENKIGGAIKEVFRRGQLDKEVEENLSDGLQENPEFVAESNKINKKRNWLILKFENLLNRVSKKETPPYIFNGDAKKGMEELELELKEPFAKIIYSRLSEMNKRLLLDHLVDNPVNPDKSEIINLVNSDDVINIISEANDNAASYSDNGYLVQLVNKRALNPDTKVDDKNCLYNLISPDGKIISENLNYVEAFEALKKQADVYQENLKQEFFQPEVTQEDVLEAENSIIVEDFASEKEREMNKLMDDILEDKQAIVVNEEKEQEYFDNFGKKLKPELEENKPEVLEQENKPEVLEQENKPEVLEQENKPEVVFDNPFDKQITSYAESIGINPEELASNSDFLNLSKEQQQFALETLRRSSLAKAKVIGYESFVAEQSSKKGWQKIGFNFNKGYHKERHKAEAIKNIENQGLDGYGKTELAWLIEVIKNGPEVKINEAGEVIVDCLAAESFSDEQKELVAKYNEIARQYIEYKPKNKKDETVYDFQYDLNKIKRDLLDGVEDYSREVEINNLFFKAKNNIELLKFLSADKETEALLNKLAKSSDNGLDKTKAIIGAQKDKAGYAALGFTLRTGTKFALANSAYLAGAISYAVGPAVAAIIGGYRGYNLGKKELTEKEELAKLGIKDQSSTAKERILATGKKEGINFGLTEKLQSLIDKLNYLRSQPNYSAEENDHILEELDLRIEYTERKIDNETIDFGSTGERNNNYFNLINTLAEAKSMIGQGVDHYKYEEYYLSERTEKLTRVKSIDLKKLGLEKIENESDESYKNRLAQNKKFVEYQKLVTDEKRLQELRKISTHDRLASFMNYNEEQLKQKESRFLLKKIVLGATMGASFAAAGAFVAEQLGIGNWLNDHFGKEATPSGSSSSSGVAESAVNPKTPVNPVGEVNNSTNLTGVEANNNVNAEEVVTTSNNAAETGSIETPEVVVENPAPQATASENFVDEISNKNLNGKSDSVWRSTKEIFKNNARELGYKGDLNDTQTLNRWAETQTASAVSNSEEISDKVFEGNKVILTQGENGPQIIIEKGSGFEPGQLDHNDQTVDLPEETTVAEKIETPFSENKDVSENLNLDDTKEVYPSEEPEPEVYNLNVVQTEEPSPMDVVSTENLDQPVEAIEVEAPEQIEVVDQGLSQAMINEKSAISEVLNIKMDDLEPKGDAFVYKRALGSATFNLKNGVLDLNLVDKNGTKIPNGFINDLRGKMSLDKFIVKNLDKTLKSWSQLSMDDTNLYKILSSGKTNSELLNQVKNQFKISSENIKISSDNRFIVETKLGKQEYFEANFKDIKKMISLLKK